jgi:hypothetical protein
MSDFSMVRGESRVLTFGVTDSEGEPLSLVGAVVRFAIKERWSQSLAEAVVVKTSDTAGEVDITDAPGGTGTITLAAADTASLPAGRYCFATDVTIAGARKSPTGLSGFVTIGPESVE